eukprot:TRINITY_DN7336_c0_g1_i7.p2 TRINITY_DN7336_c0_g1~~TRINITY_DN7336_c0_g1_i7.p2  ORF type:complete len:198 (-),score=33.05 TRINITY_DN7336_c0_g1_i7:138-731(-)
MKDVKVEESAEDSNQLPIKSTAEDVTKRMKMVRPKPIEQHTKPVISHDTTPGPGQYYVEYSRKETLKSSPETAAFKQPLNLSKKLPQRSPSIGEYSQAAYTIQAETKKLQMRYAANPVLANSNANAKRIREEDENYLGPGYYDLQRDFEEKGMRYNFFIPKDKRFRYEEEVTPGPGQYPVQEYDHWNKPSFNSSAKP